MLANAALGGATNIVEQKIKGQDFDVKEFGVSVVAGGVSGLIGGRGADAKNLGDVWETAGKRIIREGRRANRKYATKQIARYTAVRIGVKKAVAVSMGRFTAGTAGSSYFKYKLGY